MSDTKVRKPRKRAGVDYEPRDIYLAASGAMDATVTASYTDDMGNAQTHSAAVVKGDPWSLADATDFFKLMSMQLKLIALDYWTKNLKEFSSFGPPEFASSRASGGNEIRVTEARIKEKDKTTGDFIRKANLVTEDNPEGILYKSVGLRAAVPGHILELIGATEGDTLTIEHNKANGSITLTLTAG